jgi:CHRD domain
MNTMRVLPLAMVALLGVVVACGDDNNNPPPDTNFTAELNGTNEVPAVSTEASGTATLTIDGDEIDYTVETTGLANPILAHIHIAPAGENGPVRLNLCGTDDTPACTEGDGELITGSNGTTVGTPPITFDSLVSAMQSGGAYVNVHTSDLVPPDNTGPGDFPAGEIRGQVEAQ